MQKPALPKNKEFFEDYNSMAKLREEFEQQKLEINLLHQISIACTILTSFIKTRTWRISSLRISSGSALCRASPSQSALTT